MDETVGLCKCGHVEEEHSFNGCCAVVVGNPDLNCPCVEYEEVSRVHSDDYYKD